MADEASSARRTHTVNWEDPATARELARSMSGLESFKAIIRGEFPPNPAASVLGAQYREVEPGRAVLTLTPQEYHANYLGTVQGGLLCVLFDLACSAAVAGNLPPNTGISTVDLHTSFIRPVLLASGEVRCEAEVLHQGSRTVSVQARITDGAGKLCAHAVATELLLPMGG